MSRNEEKIKKILVEFGSNICKIRTTKGLTQLDLASLCDLEHTTISRIENGRTNITLKTAIILSEALNIDLNLLFLF